MTTLPHEDLRPAMARLRKALERRMKADDRHATVVSRKRKADGELVAYDTRALAAILRPALEWDGRGWRAIAAEIGVTSPDLSRVMAGQDISAGKVFAICDWLKIEARKFYRPLRGERTVFRGPSAAGRKPKRASGLVARPAGAPSAREAEECFTGKALKQRGRK